jgi:hypothetical protein
MLGLLLLPVPTEGALFHPQQQQQEQIQIQQQQQQRRT